MSDFDNELFDARKRQQMLATSFREFVEEYPQFNTFSTRMKIPCGSGVIVSVSCPTDVDIDTVEVWVQIGDKYPPMPSLGQGDGPIRMDVYEAREFVRKVKKVFP